MSCFAVGLVSSAGATGTGGSRHAVFALFLLGVRRTDVLHPPPPAQFPLAGVLLYDSS